MKRILILIFAVFIFMACTQSPTPLPPDAVDTAIAQTLAAWTAEAPTSTKTPIPTNTAVPTVISPGQTDDNALPPDPTASATFKISNTNLIIDVTTILGKPISQVEEITGKTVLITPNIGLASNNISGKPVWTVQIEDSNIFRR
jgi:PBP1b-binding outer membrane lipoprotein LpoB